MNEFESLFDDEEWVNQNMNLDPIEDDTEDNTDSEAQVGSNGKKRNSYTIDYKLELSPMQRSIGEYTLATRLQCGSIQHPANASTSRAQKTSHTVRSPEKIFPQIEACNISKCYPAHDKTTGTKILAGAPFLRVMSHRKSRIPTFVEGVTQSLPRAAG
ncbi:hypothetical protein Ddc_21902 [Ditylenchus destructor]|nr:hypothetical protein Ddc_21902 [Ditylenchus destructor]